ncbi:MAG: sigma-70 family RNA polymerase sigma factor [Clostridium sp.]|nr:sigma-70 family RNA polymerase sigma factor [Clostridium sp.]
MKVLYDLYAGRVYSFAYSLAKSREDASDIVQEVFARLWANRKDIEVGKPLIPLLFAIGKNLFISAYRKRMASRCYVDYVEYLDSLAESETASSALEYDEYKRSVAAAFKALPLRQRQIVALSKFQGMKNAEIAKELNLSEQTVKNQLSLGLKALRLSLAKIPLVILCVFFS